MSSRGPRSVFLPALGLALLAVATARSALGLELRSSAFADGEPIPTRYTCDGEDVSPPLSWIDVPAQTQSLALIVEDPDAPDPHHPRRIWVHWVLYDLPPGAGKLPAAVAPDALPAGTRTGRNDWKRVEYGGPCPPIGRHRYRHRLFALDVRLPDLDEPTRAELLEALDGHVIAESVLVGTYERVRESHAESRGAASRDTHPGALVGSRRAQRRGEEIR
ncbi:MAG: YbhB/YbcL family Raf kinase inhibitor-like protein [Myxococcota bacterium]